tara:strand:- start:124 stop:351 length:228 start_codon:yes stop_codon:yes gene_type:complete
MKYWCDMHKIYYRLNKNLNPNKILHDIKQMIATHQKLNGLDDAILSIDIKDITTTQDITTRNIEDARKNDLPKPT